MEPGGFWPGDVARPKWYQQRVTATDPPHPIWYPLGRIIVEMFRPDDWVTGVPGLATAQLISLGLMGFAIVALIVRHRNWKPEKLVKS